MQNRNYSVYIHPATLQTLKFDAARNVFVAENGDEFAIHDGIPDFTWPKSLGEADLEWRNTYEKLAAEYDKYADIPFRTYKCDEKTVRRKMIDALEIKKESNVLEIGCGDGRGSEVIAEAMNSSGKLFLQELSPAFLKNAKKRLSKFNLEIEYSIGNGSYLPYPDNYFDAAHHFGGINTFDEVARCFQELTRVVKPGGKVLIGDEGMGPWLTNSTFGKIMSNSNPLLKYQIPFHLLPVDVRDVKVEWIMMGTFFTLEFTVGVGEPQPDYFVNIPSERGGNHWTRYYGNLEGISDEGKKMALKLIREKGYSMHDWLDKVVKEAASKELNK